jgi:hypothetical protein
MGKLTKVFNVLDFELFLPENFRLLPCAQAAALTRNKLETQYP